MTESKDKRKGWLAKLVVGSQVFVNDGYDHLEVIIGISPTGRIKVGSCTYNEHGRRIGYGGYHCPYLQEVTDERLKLRDVNIKIRKLTSAMDKFRRSFDGTYKYDQALISMDEYDINLIATATAVFEKYTHKKETP